MYAPRAHLRQGALRPQYIYIFLFSFFKRKIGLAARILSHSAYFQFHYFYCPGPGTGSQPLKLFYFSEGKK